MSSPVELFVMTTVFHFPGSKGVAVTNVLSPIFRTSNSGGGGPFGIIWISHVSEIASVHSTGSEPA
jgi:hypothetical protein